MRELDLLLETYLEHRYAQSTDDQKKAFRELLSVADPDLIGYLLGGQVPQDATLAGIVSQIRDRPDA